MKNKNVGWLIIGISIFIGAIIWIFNYGVANILNATCSMGPTCSMYKTLNIQTWISIAIAAVIFLIGLFLVFSKEEKEIVVKKVKTFPGVKELKGKEFSKRSLDSLKLDNEERKVMELVIENKGSIFQSEVAEKTGLGKVKVTRILDALEAQGLVERKRRGMTNIVVLKSQ